MEDRKIIHIDLDSFFVSVECRANPGLLNKPVAIGGSSERGVVASCSYEARKFGVHSAMSGKLAKRLCPDLIFVRGNYESYSKASREVTQIIDEHVPLFEKTSIDEFYIDMSGMDKFFGTLNYAKELRQRVIRETGLPISFGLSKNKTVSKIATGLAKPNGYKYVEYGTERAFLAPLSVRKIPMIGEKTAENLLKMGIEKVAAIQNMPKEIFESKFGKYGGMLWNKANGIDHSQVVPYTERKSISSEHTFDADTTNTIMLEAMIVSMTEDLCSKMRKENFLAGCIAIKIRYADFSTFSHQLKINYTSADHLLIPKVKDLFRKLYKNNMQIRLIGVRLSNLVHGHYQINLFNDSEEQIHLYQALDKLNKRFGSKTVCRAIGMGIAGRNFNPFNGTES